MAKLALVIVGALTIELLDHTPSVHRTAFRMEQSNYLDSLFDWSTKYYNTYDKSSHIPYISIEVIHFFYY